MAQRLIVRDKLEKSDASYLRLFASVDEPDTSDEDTDDEPHDLAFLLLGSAALSMPGQQDTCFCFQLDSYDAGEQLSLFRFYREHIFLLTELLRLPAVLICPNRTVVSSVEAVCIVLNRLAFPGRWSDRRAHVALSSLAQWQCARGSPPPLL